MPEYAYEPETDPAKHWMTRHQYGRTEDDRRTKVPLVITEEIARKRENLIDDGTDLTPPIPVAGVDLLVLGSVLEECAARLRLAAEGGNPAGSVPLAEFADELSDRMYRLHGLIGS